MKLYNLWALATAEVRTCKRLVRTWVFIALALFFSVGTWIYQSANYLSNSSSGPHVGLASPRYLVPDLGEQILVFFSIGILFLAFDVRLRDVRDRIGEVMDTRPNSNLELLTGRLIGIVFLLTVPAFAVMGFISIFGWVAESIDAPFGSLIEPVSVVSFLTLDIVPNLVFWASLTYFLAIVMRYRLLAATSAMMLIIGMYFLLNNLPADFAAAFSTSGSGAHPSELAPHFTSLETVTIRVILVVVSIALLCASAALHPRTERNQLRSPQLIGGAVFAVLGAAGVFFLIAGVLFERKQFDQWVTAHAQHQLHSSTDIEEISGKVDIKPGRGIDLDLTLTLNTQDSPSLDDWLFSLNPGYSIHELHVDGEVTVDFEFENGLLTIPQTKATNEQTQIRLVASGMPNARFAYLDSAVNPTRPETGQEAQRLANLGKKSFIHHSQFIALMPEVYWMPSSGSAYGTTEWDATGNDFYALDIQVFAPREWKVVGPGRPQLHRNGSRTLFHFRPKVPIRDLALVGSKYETYSINVQDIEFELMFNRKHRRFLDTLIEIGPALSDWLDERITEWKLAGLEYPFDTLSLVEVPVSLRVFGGGWRMDSVYAQPGFLMMRESGLPIARFDNALKNMPTEVEESDEKRSEYILEIVTQFFKNDQSGGNPLANVAKNFVLYQTMASGHGSVAINYLINELSKLLVTSSDEDSLFSLFVVLDPRQNFRSRNVFTFDYQPDPNIWHQGFTNRPSVWEPMAESSLADVDYIADPDVASRILFLRTNAIAHQILERYRTEQTGALLKELSRRYGGSTFTRNEFFQVAQHVGLDFDEVAGNWLDGVGLPGFLAANAKTERLQDSDSGESVYQTSFILRNNEPVPGVVAVSYIAQSGTGAMSTLPAFRIDGLTSLKIAFQDSEPTRYIWISPEISLNRGQLRLEVPQLQDYQPQDSPVLPFMAEVEWENTEKQSIVVDDLDDGFSSTDSDEAVGEKEEGQPWWLRFLLASTFEMETEFDHGLPEYSFFSEENGRWFRQESSSSHGMYRKTHALVRGQSEQSRASFQATLPETGLWRLEYHLPAVIPFSLSSESSVAFGFDGVGTSTSVTITASSGDESPNGDHDFFLVRVNHGDRTKEIQVEPSMASQGWMELGNFEILSSKVEVVASPGSSELTVADAIKWTRVESKDE